MCYWNTTSNSCLDQCMTRFPLPSESSSCWADPQCMFDSNERMCKKTCELLSNQFDCNAVSTMCTWYQGKCVLGCENSATNVTNCRMLERCMWDSDQNKCRRNCTQEGAATRCTNDAMCRYDNDLASCRMRCVNFYTTDLCATDGRCEWGTASHPGCDASCEFRYSGQSDCDSDPTCFWDGTVCTKSCDKYFDQSSCTLGDVQCEWDVTHCRRTCRYAYNNDENGCTADANCAWNRNARTCSTVCTAVLDQSICMSDEMCQWKVNSCEERCSFRYNTSSSCNSDPQCTWVGYASACRNFCGGYALMPNATLQSTKDLCSKDQFCEWSGTQCVPTCTILHGDRVSCNNDTGCMWYARGPECRKTCSQLTSTASCISQPMCLWADNRATCDKICKYRYMTSTSCDSDSECMWSTNDFICEASCAMYGSQPTCESNDMCIFDTDNNVCIRRCVSLPTANCTQYSRCELQADIARGKDASGHYQMMCGTKCGILYAQSPPSACDASSQCMYDTKAALCVKACDRYNTEEYPSQAPTAIQSMCLAIDVCTLDGTDTTCRQACKFRYSEPRSCNADPYCFWDTTRSICTKSCDKVTIRDECINLATCEWAQSTTECRLRCENRFIGDSQAGACDATDDCHWDYATSMCRKECKSYETFYTNASDARYYCNADALCEWKNNNPTGLKCKDSCEVLYSTETTCIVDVDCMWDPSREMCTLTCVDIDKGPDCAAVINCRWKPTADEPCKKRCSFREYTNLTACETNDDECMWDYTQETCRRRCSEQVDPDSCMSDSWCEWLDNICHRKCPTEQDPVKCVNDGWCMWNETTEDHCWKVCDMKYPTQDSCSQDWRCMWDVGPGSCRLNCDWHATSICLQDSMCNIGVNGCMVRCILKYGDAAGCNSDAECLWDWQLGVCNRNCDKFFTVTECNNAPACMWSAGQCRQQCPNRYTTETTCNSDVECMWKTDDGAGWCAGDCPRRTNSTYCELNTMCRWDSSSQSCGYKCENEYTDQPSCDGDEKCMWNPVTGTCSVGCDNVYSRAECQGMTTVCRWDVATTSCDKQCKFRYNNASSCSADAECSWYNGGCKMDCSRLQSTNDCLSDTQCTLQAASGLCRMSCALSGMNDCNANDWCDWLTDDAVCVNRCGLRYTVQGTCNADSECMWDVVTQVCVRSCATLYYLNSDANIFSSACTANNMCIFNSSETQSRQCAPRCQYRYTTQQSCNTDPDCLWDSFNSRCSADCALQFSTAPCLATSMCQWDSTTNLCTRLCRYRYTDPTACDVDPDCQWVSNEFYCAPSCARHGTTAICETDRLCMWSGASHNCVVSCSVQYATRTDCRTDSNCEWNSIDGMCKKTCLLNILRTDCALDPKCNWNTNNTCGDKCQYIYADSTSCDNDPKCNWDYGINTCSDRCGVQGTQATCESQNMCTWSSDSGFCRMTCANHINSNQCGQDTFCEWVSAKSGVLTCRGKCNILYKSAGQCNGDTNCMWSTDDNECVSSCEVRPDEQCAGSSRCILLNNGCSTDCKYKHLDITTCNADPSCTYDTVSGICGTACNATNNADICASNTMCMWANAACSSSCRSLHTAQSPCDADMMCLWDPSRQLCLANCTTSDTDTCLSNSGCRWRGDHCELSCYNKYTTNAVSCRADSNCAINPSSGSCTDACATLGSEPACDASSQLCIWRSLSSRCVTKCQFTATAPSTCAATSGCQWDTAVGSCGPDCGSVPTQVSCNANDGCTYMSHQCVTACKRFGPADCLAAARCQLDNSTGLNTCTTACGIRYSSESPCNQDAICMWDSSLGLCRASCPTLMAPNYPSMSQAQVLNQCSKDAYCSVSQDKCINRCEYAHTNEASCEDDVYCMWDTTRQTCRTACPVIPGQDTCEQNPVCEWVQTTNKCRMQCEYRAPTQTTCIVDTECTWSAATSKCTSSCEGSLHNTPTTCTTSSLCRWITPASTNNVVSIEKCVKRCDAAYLTQQPCNADPLCLWDASYATCRTTCSMLALHTDCDTAGAVCRWNSAGKYCEKQCQVAATTAAPCNMVSGCYWRNSTAVCTRLCNGTFTQDECRNNGDCNWNDNEQRCELQCSFISDMVACDNSMRCIVEGTLDAMGVVNGSTCVDEPGIRFPTEQGCNNNLMNDTIWNPDIQRCVQACAFRPTPSKCQADAICNSTSATTCETRCKYLYKAQPNCLNDARCMWDNQRLSCASKCDLYEAQDTCESNPSCMWADIKCTLRCSYMWTGGVSNKTACNSTSVCNFNDATGVCENVCSKVTGGEFQCDVTPFCLYSTADGICEGDCQLLNSQARCEGRAADCMWDSSAGACKKTCARAASQVACTLESSLCYFDGIGSKCKMRCKFRNTDQASCSGDSDCLWDDANQVCKPTCARFPTEVDCQANSECEWFGGKCVFQCTMIPVSQCKASGGSRCTVRQPGFTGGTGGVTVPICVKSCQFAYPTQETCNSDDNCMFNVNTDLCTEDCPRVAFDDKISPEATCNATAQCVWMGDLGCTIQCSAAYIDQTSCDANSLCQWDRLRRQCAPQCNLAPAKDSCISNKMCEWKTGNASCVLQCAYRYPMQSQCAADSQCTWLTASAQCTSKCDATDATTCTADTTCQWQGSTSTCTNQCSSKCFTETCCKNAEGCMFDINNGQCRTTCSQLNRQACVNEVGMCSYNDVVGRCEMLCGITYNSTTTAAICNADTMCMYDTTNMVCDQRCISYATQGTCITMSMCKWDSDNNLCSRMCIYNTNSTTCTPDITCDWADSRSSPLCRSKCVYRYSEPTSCNGDGECMWDGSVTQCADKCQRLDEGHCRQQAMCMYDITQADPCRMACDYLSDQTSCISDTWCTWTASQSICTKSCPIITSQAACLQTGVCEWTYEKCQKKCSDRHTTLVSCNVDSNCQWNPYSNSCVNTCSKKTDGVACTADSMCEWVNSSSTCIKSCASISNADSCHTEANCMWSITDGICKTTCTQISLDTTCKTEAMCSWRGSGCEMLCKYQYEDKDSCNADLRCMYEDGNCAPTCSESPTQTTCNAHSSCSWDTNENVCRIKCSMRSSTQCGVDTACAWNGVSCGSKCVTAYTTLETCTADTQCMWDSGDVMCKDACKTYITSGTCQSDNECAWNIKGSYCQMACEYGYNDATTCINAGCTYDSTRAACYTSCSRLTDLSSCTADPVCRWTVNSTCTPGCTSYTTSTSCPAQCLWDSTNAICTEKCTAHTDAECTTNSNCEWNGLTCQMGCEQAYSTSSSCSTDSRCMWDGDATTCKPACALRKMNDCKAEPALCRYDTGSGHCLESCVRKYGSNQPSCDGDTNCAFNPLRSVCTISCESQGTAESCSVKPMCEWNSQTSSCKRRCIYKLSTDSCTADSECKVNATGCTKRCQYQYTTQQTCSLDNACMWSVSNRMCRETCSSISDGQLCVSESMCKYANSCELKCVYRHIDTTSCSADLECQWDLDRSQCTEQCSVASDPTTCRSLPICYYDGTNCVQQCSYRYGTKTSCTAASNEGCEWNNYTLSCENECSFLTYDQCVSNTMCRLEAAASGKLVQNGQAYICADTCNLKYKQKSVCDSDDSCKWDSLSNMCRENCNVTTTKADCESAGMCIWQGGTATCAPKCAFAGSDCNSRPDCTVTSSGDCAAACNQRGSQAACTGDRTCIWDNTTATCAQNCPAILDQRNCNSNMNCIWDNTNSLCLMQCTMKYTVQVPCEADSRCMWDITNAICRTACSFIIVDSTDPVSISSCTSEAMCEVSSNLCKERCDSRAFTSTSCAGYADCQWNPDTGKCASKCSTLDSNSCVGAVMCMMYGDSCINRCEYTSTNPNDCTGVCKWDTVLNQCRPTCDNLPQTTCKMAGMCLWNATQGVCTATCPVKHATMFTCDADKECIWDPTNNDCSKMCELVASQVECQSLRDTCEWSAQFTECVTRCDVKFYNRSSALCEADSRCHYNNILGTCVTSCPELPNQPVCMATSGCNWNPATEKCKTDCAVNTNQATCSQDDTCQWNANANSCTLKCGLKYPTSQDSCNADVYCQYDSRGGSCTHMCIQVIDATICEETILCAWKAGASTCQPSCTAQYVSSNTCSADSNCEWNGDSQTCYTQCNASTSVSGDGCTRNPSCMFDATTDTCSPICSKLSGCPSPQCDIGTSGFCVYDCKTTPMDKCANISACRITDTGACTPTCAEQYKNNQQACQHDAECMWNKVNSICAPLCKRLTDIQCASSPQCMMVNSTCSPACSQVYTTFADCDSDADCMWDLDNSVCKRTCRTYSSYSGCNSQTVCNWVSRLGVCVKKCNAITVRDCPGYDQCTVQTTNVSSICIERCAYRYGARGDCNADPACEWYSATTTCGDRRCISPNMDKCISDSGCLWNTTTVKCDRKPCQWSDAPTCDAFDNCEWYLGNKTCIISPCLETDASSCMGDGTGICTWNSTSSNCQRTCAFFGTKDECDSLPCEWSLGGVCRETCLTIYGADETSCRLDANCLWNIDIQRCAMACSKYPDPTSCDAPSVAGMCIYDGSNCKSNCQHLYPTSDDIASCTADPVCEVMTGADGSDRCIEPCDLLNLTTCLAHPLCTPQDNSCVPGCGIKYADAISCSTDGQCMWLPMAGSCIERCEISNPNPSPTDGCPTYCVATSDGHCASKCANIHQDATGCQADANCLWNVNTAACGPGCSSPELNGCPNPCVATSSGCMPACNQRYGSVNACGSDPKCMWNYGSASCELNNCTGHTPCRSTCYTDATDNSCHAACSAFPIQTACDPNTYCTWIMSTGTCAQACDTYTASTCTSTTCFVAGSICIDECSTVNTAVKCSGKLSLGCMWDGGSSQCVKKCEYKYSSASDCSQDPLCAVVNNVCTSLVCAYSDEDTCASDTRCVWASGACAMSSCNFETQSDCETANCRWTPEISGGTCATSECRGRTLDVCAEMVQCEINNGVCIDRFCFTTSVSDCTSDPSCDWDPATNKCQPTSQDCMYTDWSEWSQCSVPCGMGTSTRSRKIVRQPGVGGAACTNLSYTETCSIQSVCVCSQYDNLLEECTFIDTCKVMQGKCVSTYTPEGKCAMYTTSTSCGTATYCSWWGGMCIEMGNVGYTSHRTFSTASTCTPPMVNIPTAPNAIGYGFFDFVNIFNSANFNPAMGTIQAITVSIEDGYRLYMDFLAYNQLPLNATITTKSNATLYVIPRLHQGIWVIVGPADISVFAEVLRNIQFMSTSSDTVPRKITWAVGHDTIFSAATRHLYFSNISANPLSWMAAKANCESATLFGLKGQLAQVSSSLENNILSWKLGKSGWIGGTDEAQEGSWMWVDGIQRTQFWSGLNSDYGGVNVKGAYSAWEPVGIASTTGEPNNMPGDNYLLLQLNGYWSDRPYYNPRVRSFFCEFGSDSETVPGYVYGMAVVQRTGCLFPSIAGACNSIVDSVRCSSTSECRWDTANSKCMTGCESLTNSDDCMALDACYLDISYVPSRCIVNACNLSTTCADAECYRTADDMCQYKTTCDRFDGNEARCDGTQLCQYIATTDKCAPIIFCDSYMANSTCNTDDCQARCISDVQCDLITSGDLGTCVPKLCDSTAGASCDASNCNSKAMVAPTGTALSFRPGDRPLQIFTGHYNTSTRFGVAVSISEGYTQGDQLIFLSNSNPGFISQFDTTHGLLTVNGVGNATLFDNVMYSVHFASSISLDRPRTITWTMIENSQVSVGPVHLPSQNVFVEYVANSQISRSAAAAQCAIRTLGGAHGTLASAQSASEVKNIINTVGSTENAWIAGSGQLVGGMPVWSWDNTTSGPSVMYRGDAYTGTSTTFTNFVSGEPAAMNEGYVMYTLMMASGKWITRAAWDSADVGGYYCMYDDTAAASAATGIVTLQPFGCLPKMCNHNIEAACELDVDCHWDNATTTCTISACSGKQGVTDCSTTPGCYYDAILGSCVEITPAQPDTCTTLSPEVCMQTPQCLLRNNTCIMGCGVYPNEDSCANDPSCIMEDGSCVKLLCGSAIKETCLQNLLCVYTSSGCQPQECLTRQTQTDCIADIQCEYLAGSAPPCQAKQCGYTTDLMCITNPLCAWDGTSCGRNGCGLKTQSDCMSATGECVWSPDVSQCVRAQCAFQNQSDCNSAIDPTTNIEMCLWTVSGGSAVCTPKDITSMSKSLSAAANTGSSGVQCTITTKSYTGLIVALVLAVVLLFALFGFIVYRQRKVQEATSTMGYGRMGGDDDNELSTPYMAPELLY